MSIRADFCAPEINRALGRRPRTHANMIAVTEEIFGKGRGIARPGKTACERARRERLGKK